MKILMACSWRVLAGVLFAVGLLLPSGASALTIVLDTLYNGDSPASPTPYLTADFATVAPGEVTLTLTASLEDAGEFVGGLGFNIDPLIVPSDISVLQDSGPIGTVFSGAQDAQTVMGSGTIGFGFDFVLDFATAPPGDRFNDSLVAVFTLTGTGITDASFNFVNENNGFIVGAHIQGVTCTPESQSEDCLPGGPGTTSGFVSQVPEPTAGVLMSLGLVGLTWFSRSRRS